MSVTFEQNLSRLLDLKKEGQSLLQLYSKDVFNFNHVENLQQKTHQLKEILQELEELRGKSEYDRQMAENRISGLHSELSRCERINHDLLQKIETLELEKKSLAHELGAKETVCEDLQKEKEGIAQKYIREMENLKLMYTQELYIAKRFDKPR